MDPLGLNHTFVVVIDIGPSTNHWVPWGLYQVVITVQIGKGNPKAKHS